MATTVEMEPVIIVREMTNGAVYAHPVADPTLACRSVGVEQALAKQERFLTDYLETVPAGRLADFTETADARLVHVPAILPCADLPRRIRVVEPVTVTCLVIPHRGALWVHVLPLAVFVFLEDETELERGVVAEVEKAAAARSLSVKEFVALLPAASTSMQRVRVRVKRNDLGDQGAQAAKRRARDKDREHRGAGKLLRSVGVDLVASHRASAPPPIVGRAREIEALGSLLLGPERLSVLLVGQEMAGKSGVVHGWVQAGFAENRQGGALAGRMIIATSGAQLVAGQSGFGQLQQRIDEVMRAAEALDAIVYFDNLADMLSGRPGTSEDMVSGILPYLTDDRVRVVGELTPEQVSHYENMHVGFFAALSRVSVEPLDKAQTREVLQARIHADTRREPSKPAVQLSAVAPLLDLCQRYLAYEAFPGKAVRLYDELRAVNEAEVQDDGTPRPIGAADVYRSFSTRSGIPMFLLQDDRRMKLEQIESFFAKRVIGQREAVSRVAQTLCMVKAHLQPPAKPLSNFLFIGPTGVGKTEVAKTLARFLFGSPDRMLRFDMSEYMDPLAAERLIRGTDRDEGELTKRVRQQPFCVVLLDEIEKAHSAVFDLLLQVCGEGRLSDARGRTTWFHNAIIIMTSNLGAAHRRPDAGFREAESADAASLGRYYLDQVDKHFRPEFVNRIDRVVPFAALGRGEIAEVANVAVERIAQRDGFVGRGASLEVSDAARESLANDGFSLEYGARALRRHLEDALVAPVAALASAHAAVFDGARIEVTLAAEDTMGAAQAAQADVDDDAVLEATQEVGGLRLQLFRAPLRSRRRGSTTLASISELRRAADRCLHSATLTEMTERIDYLVADLSGAKHERAAASSPDISVLVAELAKLRALRSNVYEAYESIAAAEDLAMVAQIEGTPAALFAEEAQEAFGTFEAALVHAVYGFVAGESFTFFARGTEGPKGLGEFLVGFLRASAARRWSVVVHQLPQTGGVDSWPRECAYGPPRDPQWCLEHLLDAAPSVLRRSWRGALVSVRGPAVAGLLANEMGTWRFQSAVQPTHHVELYRMADRTGLSSAELTQKALAPPPCLDAVAVQTLAPHRSWDGDTAVHVGETGSAFEVKGVADYWRLLERIQFGGVAKRILAGKPAVAAREA